MPLDQVPQHPWIKKYCKEDGEEEDGMDVDENEPKA